MLGDRVEDAHVWDLFAGTGATGIEALSRGAAAVTFVEKSNAALSVLRSNLDLVGVDEEEAMVVKGDAWQTDLLAEDEFVADLVFVDPPYRAVAEDPVRAACFAAELAGVIAPGGLLCFHFEDGLLDEDDFDDHLAVELRSWGRTAMALIEADGAARAGR